MNFFCVVFVFFVFFAWFVFHTHTTGKGCAWRAAWLELASEKDTAAATTTTTTS
jgi:hypothetical protein